MIILYYFKQKKNGEKKLLCETKIIITFFSNFNTKIKRNISFLFFYLIFLYYMKRQNIYEY